MSSDTTPRLNLPLLIGGQAQKHLTMNAGLLLLESLVQATVLSRTVTAQPASPADGDSYIIAAGASGADWSARALDDFVVYDSGAWSAVTFPKGALVHINDENRFVVRATPGWTNFDDLIVSLDNLAHVGIGTAADSSNVLAMRGPAALLTAIYAASSGSGDIGLALNKETDSDTAQILLQKDFSTRASLGLLGDNSVTLKVSPDGSSFTTALTVDNSTGKLTTAGQVQFPATQNPSTDPNTLDDYEEGTWTPVFSQQTTPPTGVTYTAQSGAYTKIGNVVHWTMRIVLSSKGTTGTGNVMLSGLPFALKGGDSDNAAPAQVSNTAYASGYTAPIITPFPATATMTISLNGSGLPAIGISWANCTDTSLFRATGSYLVS